MLINRCFNIRSHITVIYSTNMNLDVLQCKNYWRQEHTTLTYYMYSIKCLKCNRLHKLKHYRDIAWCCKSNFKMNSSRLKTPRNKLCLYMFKYTNCKGNHQVNSYNCSFQEHRFNCDWHNKKTQEFQETRANLICLNVGGNK